MSNAEIAKPSNVPGELANLNKRIDQLNENIHYYNQALEYLNNFLRNLEVIEPTSDQQQRHDENTLELKQLKDDHNFESDQEFENWLFGLSLDKLLSAENTNELIQNQIRTLTRLRNRLLVQKAELNGDVLDLTDSANVKVSQESMINQGLKESQPNKPTPGEIGPNITLSSSNSADSVNE